MTTFENLAKKYNLQLTDDNGVKLVLLQDAYLDGTNDDSYYTALAVSEEATKQADAENEEPEATHKIIWPITVENPEECDDESNMCDWKNNYEVIKL